MNYFRMALKNWILFCLSLSLIPLSCKNDIDINAEWKEIAVVYGLLDIGQTVQYIRIEKAYLNQKEDAVRLAGISDSLYFDSLSVKIIGMDASGNIQQNFILKEDSNIPKDTGIFGTTTHVLYRGDFAANPTLTYKIEITNPRSGSKYESYTPIVQRIRWLNFPTEFSFTPDKKSTLRILSGKNARAYDVNIQLHIREKNKISGDSQVVMLKYLAVSSSPLASLKGFEEVYLVLNGKLIFDYLAKNLVPDSSITRRLIRADIIVSGAGEEFYNYLSINKPSLGIVQKKPEYSNITNGLGIFSSRETNYFLNNLNISDSTHWSLFNFPDTKALGFER